MTAEIVLQSVVSGLMFGGVIALVAVGISLIWGVMDVINFAYGEYLMWAMYLTFFLYAGAGLDPLVSVPVNALVLFAAGVLTYRLVIERVMRTKVHSAAFCPADLQPSLMETCDNARRPLAGPYQRQALVQRP